MDKGDILLHREFSLHDSLKEKYLILLNQPDLEKNEDYLFVWATSKPIDKLRISGCNQSKYYFFIPKDKEYFPKDTWIEFWDIHPTDIRSIMVDIVEEKAAIVDQLSDQTIKEITNCVRKIKSIPRRYKKMIIRR